MTYFFDQCAACTNGDETSLCAAVPSVLFRHEFHMTRDDFDAFCKSLPATTHVIQWGNASVWKVGGKIFAICSRWGDGDHQRIGFKCSDMSYSLLTQQDGMIPAPYLARAKWVQME